MSAFFTYDDVTKLAAQFATVKKAMDDERRMAEKIMATPVSASRAVATTMNARCYRNADAKQRGFEQIDEILRGCGYRPAQST